MCSSVTTGDMEETSIIRWLRATEQVETTFRDRIYLSVRPALLCHDGFEMSVQASPGHNCNFYTILDSPDPFVPGSVDYKTAEVYCLSQPEPLFASVIEGESDGIEDPIGYVPLELIQQVVDAHGGIVGYDPVPPAPPEPEKPKMGRARRMRF